MCPLSKKIEKERKRGYEEKTAFQTWSQAYNTDLLTTCF